MDKSGGDVKSSMKMIRQFGPCESFTDSCSVYRNLTAGAALTIKTTKPFGLSQAEDAFHRLQNQHLQLQSCFKRKTTFKSGGFSLNPFSWFRKPEAIPKSEFWQLNHPTLPLNWIHTNDPTGYLKILENELQVTFQEMNILWRAIIVQTGEMTKEVTEATIILIFHPSISDMRGAYFIFNDLLGHLSDVLDGNKEKMTKAVMHESFHECIDESMEGGMTMGDRYKMVKFIINCIRNSCSSPYIKINPVPTVPDYTTRMAFKLTINESDSILRQVKDKGISLIGLFTASGLAATHELSKLNYGTSQKLGICHEVDMRKHCNNLEKKKGRINGTMCNYSDQSFETRGVKNASELWDLATVAHTTIVPKIGSEATLEEIVMCFKYHASGNCYKWFGTFANNTTPRNEFAIYVNEDIDDSLDDRDNIKVDGIAENISAFSMGSPFFHGVVVYKGKITYALHFNGNYTTMDKAREYGETTLKYIKMISGGK